MGKFDYAFHLLTSYENDHTKLKTGATSVSGPPPIANLPLDQFDLPCRGMSAANPEEGRTALIPDLRNDENLAVGQTHLAFIRFHNRVFDRLVKAGTPSSMLFERARELVVKHYRSEALSMNVQNRFSASQ